MFSIRIKGTVKNNIKNKLIYTVLVYCTVFAYLLDSSLDGIINLRLCGESSNTESKS